MSTTATPPAAPRVVIRGAECHPVQNCASSARSATPEPAKIDWLRFTGPRALAPHAQRTLRAVFGEQSELSPKGFSGMPKGQSERWGDSTGVYFSRVCEWSLVEITGSMLGTLSRAEIIALALALLEIGYKPTRVDVAVDWRGDCAGMGDELWSAVERRECVGIRLVGDDPGKWKSAQWYCVRTPWCEPVPTIYLGQRGTKGSGRFVRFYDKGHQTGTAPRNTWMRWEAEFSDHCARAVLDELVKHPDDAERWHAISLGAVDFRLNPERRLERRPRAAWWSWWLQAAEPLMAKVKRAPVGVVRKARWLNQQVLAGTMALAKKVKMSSHELIDTLAAYAGPVTPSKSATRTPAARELVRWFIDGHTPSEEQDEDYGWIDRLIAPMPGGPPG